MLRPIVVRPCLFHVGITQSSASYLNAMLGDCDSIYIPLSAKMRKTSTATFESADGEGVNELERRRSPLLASPQGGVAERSEKHREASAEREAGVVFRWITKGKPPRLLRHRLLRDIFLMSQPPLLAVMQGDGMNESECGSKLQLLSDNWSRQVQAAKSREAMTSTRRLVRPVPDAPS